MPIPLAIPLIAAGIGAVAGGAIGHARQKRQENIEDADRKLAGETQRYSWITGNKASPIRYAGSFWDTIGSSALGGMQTGASLGTNMAMMKYGKTPTGGGSGIGASGDYGYAGVQDENVYDQMQNRSRYDDSLTDFGNQSYRTNLGVLGRTS